MIRRKPTIAFIGFMASCPVFASNCAKEPADTSVSKTEFPGENDRAVAALRADNALLHRKMRVLEEELRMRQAGQGELTPPEQTNADLSPRVEASDPKRSMNEYAKSSSRSKASRNKRSKRPTRSSKAISLAPLPHSSPEGLENYWRDTGVQVQEEPQEESRGTVTEENKTYSDENYDSDKSMEAVRKFRIVGSRAREVTPRKKTKAESRSRPEFKSKPPSPVRSKKVEPPPSQAKPRVEKNDGAPKERKSKWVDSRKNLQNPHRPPKSSVPASVETAYSLAMQKYKKGKFKQAEKAFATIAKQNPNHGYADNALYWQGESLYDQGRFTSAIAIFTQVIERYSSGNKISDALLKIALCYRKLGDYSNARDVLKQLISMFPNSEAGAIAQQRLSNRRKAKI